jgi:hypothetical protein
MLYKGEESPGKGFSLRENDQQNGVQNVLGGQAKWYILKRSKLICTTTAIYEERFL